jgi:hypothetical protein
MRPFIEAPKPLKAVILLLLLEAMGLAVVALFLIFELLSGGYQNLYAEIFLIVVAAFATLWVLVVARELLNKKRWARSAALFWQLMQGAVGAGALAEADGQLLGFALISPAAILLVLLFNKQVIAATNEAAEG